MVHKIVEAIKKCSHTAKNGSKAYQLSPTAIHLPSLAPVKDKTVWQKFAESKNIRKNKKVFCRKTNKYISIKKAYDET